jgi:excisionase family DNA binding protein
MTTTNEVERLLYTTEEAAAALGIGVTKLKELIRSGDLRSVKVGALRRVPVSALQEYVQLLRLEQAVGLPSDARQVGVMS